MKSDRLKETSLRYFLEVARCGSISLAAERLHVAASAISRQIKGLEEVLQVRLFERHPRGMVPSAAGELLAAHARHMSLDADRVVADILALEGVQRGQVLLGCTEGFGMDLLPGLIALFHRQYPGIQFTLRVAGPAEVADMVRNGDVDIGLGFSRQAHKDLRIELQRASPVVMIARADHPLAGRDKVSLRQLAGYPLALPAAETSLRQIFDIACSRQGLVIEPVLTSNSAPALHRYVLNSGVASIASRLSVRDAVANGQLVAVPLLDRRLGDRGIELQTLRGRTLPKVVRTFLDFLLRHLENTSF